MDTLSCIIFNLNSCKGILSLEFESITNRLGEKQVCNLMYLSRRVFPSSDHNCLTIRIGIHLCDWFAANRFIYVYLHLSQLPIRYA